MKLELKQTSWENLFECIRKREYKGNFWASVQYLESQYKSKINSEIYHCERLISKKDCEFCLDVGEEVCNDCIHSVKKEL
jgi:hypothetical protein